MLDDVSFGDWLKRRRKALGLTQEQFAQQLNCSTITLRKIEAEERRPSAQMVDSIAQALNVPSHERAAFLKFARGNLQASSFGEIKAAPWRASPMPAHSNLPSPTTSLIGRGQEIADVRGYMRNEAIRLVTLIGPPGIGKTRLSIEVARASLSDFPDGIFFVALAPVSQAAFIAPTVAQALGYPAARNVSTGDQLKEGIGTKQMLLVLDNCEHLIEEVALLASDLLSACPRIKILATSRESLRVPGEWLYPVPAFDLPAHSSSMDLDTASKLPALKLFTERARAVRPAFVLTMENIPAVSSICRQLDGLPLAIELIAARTRLMPPQALLERLTGQFMLTADGMRPVSERQRTLNHAIGWSYRLLSPEEQKLFAYLSVFSGGFTLDSVEAIFSQKLIGKPLLTLLALLDKSLLQRVQEDDVNAEPRYTMLATIQEYARERLREMGGETEVHNKHLAYFLSLAEKAAEELRGDRQLEWLQRLQALRDNLRAALDWAIETRQTETALQMACKLHWFWFMRGDHSEGRQWLDRVLEMPETPHYPEAHAELLTQLAHHTYLQVGPLAMRPYVEQALSITRAHADKHNTARALTMLGLALRGEEDFMAARSALEESSTLHQEVHDEWGHAHALMCLAWVFYDQGDSSTMLSLNERALAVFRKLGSRYMECVVLRSIGVGRMKLGDLKSSVAALREALILARQLDSKNEIGMTLWRYVEAARYAEKPIRAVRLASATKSLLDSIGAWTEEDDRLLEDTLAPCRLALGESAFAETMEQGRLMTMEQAITYALEEAGSGL